MSLLGYETLSYSNTSTGDEGENIFDGSLVERNSDILSGGIVGEFKYHTDEDFSLSNKNELDSSGLEKRQLQQELQEARLIISKLEDDNKHLEKENSRFEEEVQEYALKVMEMGEHGSNSWPQSSVCPGLTNAHASSSEMADSNKHLQAQLKHAEAQVMEKDKEVEKIVKELEEKDEVLLKERKELQEMARKLEEERKKKNGRGPMNAVDKLMHVKLDASKKRCLILEEKYEKAMQEVGQYKQELTGVLGRAHMLEKDKMLLHEESSNTCQIMEEENCRLMKELNCLQQDMGQRNMEVKDEIKRCKKLEEELLQKKTEWTCQHEAMEGEKQKMTTQIFELREDLDDAKKMHRKESVKSDELNSRVLVLLEEKDSIIKEERESKLRAVEDKQRMETDVTEMCTGYKDEADKAWLNYDQLKEKSEKESEENEELRNKYRNITARSDGLNNRIKSYEKEIVELKMEVGLVLQEKSGLKNRMLIMQKEMDTMRDEILAKQFAAVDFEDSFMKERQSNTKLVKKKNQEKQEEVKRLKEVFSNEERKWKEKNADLQRSNGELMEQLNKLAARQCQAEFGMDM